MSQLYEDLLMVTVTAPADTRKAAENLERLVTSMIDYRIAPWSDIASKHPMKDENGKILLTDVFGWSTNPKEQWWLRSSRQALDIVSPIVAACRYESEPFWCSQGGFHSECLNSMLNKLGVENFTVRSSMHAAIVVPVHMSFGQIGAVSFTPKDESKYDLSDDFKEFAPLISQYARRFVSSYVKTWSDIDNRGFAYKEPLTRREIECLYWASLGKTNEEISIILKMSHSTVRFHISNACLKLSAVNRGQAVAKASRLGYLSPR